MFQGSSLRGINGGGSECLSSILFFFLHGPAAGSWDRRRSEGWPSSDRKVGVYGWREEKTVSREFDKTLSLINRGLVVTFLPGLSRCLEGPPAVLGPGRGQRRRDVRLAEACLDDALEFDMFLLKLFKTLV